jgi:hypothetical protein
MKSHSLSAIGLVLISLAGAACGTGTQSLAPSATPAPTVATFDGYATAFCAGFTSLIRGVGNPDAGTPSVLSKSLDDAVAASDGAVAERVGATITTELESGRQQAALAGGWQPGKAATVALDHVIVAFEALTTAKVAVAKHVPGAAEPGAAFNAAGGREAWAALSAAVGALAVPAGASPKPCPAFSGTP